MGIKFNCCECGRSVEFPDTPNFDIDKHEQQAHILYTEYVNNDGRCCYCSFGLKDNK